MHLAAPSSAMVAFAAVLACAGLVRAQPVSSPVPTAIDPAAATGRDSVITTAGEVVYGTVIDATSHTGLILSRPDGTLRTIDWSLVASISGPSLATRAVTPYRDAAASLLGLDALRDAPDRVRLEIVATGRPVSISVVVPNEYVRDGPHQFTLPMRQICSTPCVLHVPPGDFGFVATRDEVSLPYRVPVGAHGARVRVRRLRDEGAEVAVAGIGAAAVLGLGFVWGIMVCGVSDATTCIAGMVTAAVGAVGVIAAELPLDRARRHWAITESLAEPTARAWTSRVQGGVFASDRGASVALGVRF